MNRLGRWLARETLARMEAETLELLRIRHELEEQGTKASKGWAKEADHADAAERRAEEAETRAADLERKLAALDLSALPELGCIACPSRNTYVIRHIIGWRRGQDAALPEPLGATVQCVDCGAVWHATAKGATRAQAVKPPKEPREKPPTRDDSDLKWR